MSGDPAVKAGCAGCGSRGGRVDRREPAAIGVARARPWLSGGRSDTILRHGAPGGDRYECARGRMSGPRGGIQSRCRMPAWAMLSSGGSGSAGGVRRRARSQCPVRRQPPRCRRARRVAGRLSRRVRMDAHLLRLAAEPVGRRRQSPSGTGGGRRPQPLARPSQ